MTLLLLLQPVVSAANEQAGTPAKDEALHLTSDRFDITFSTRGGVPLKWVATSDGPETAPVEILDPGFLTSSSFRPLSVLTDGTGTIDVREYTVQRSTQDDAELLKFTSPIDGRGLQVIKTYELSPGSRSLSLQVELRNGGDQALHLGADGLGPGISLGPGLGYAAGRSPEFIEEGRDTSVRSFFKTADGVFGVDAPGESPFAIDYPTVDPDDDPEQNTGLWWGGLHKQDFVLVLSREEDKGSGAPFVRARVQLDTSAAVADLLSEDDLRAYCFVTFFQPEIDLAPGASTVSRYSVFAGPKQRTVLSEANPEYESILFHYLWDWLAALVLVLEFALNGLRAMLGSWGVSIVVFAVLLRVLTLPLTLYSAKQQMELKTKTAELNPLIVELKLKHKDDADARDEAIIGLYKEYGINPMSHLKGCLPLFIQLPIMVALFNLLLNSYDLRGVSFLWIHDLTLSDRLFPLGFSLPWLGSYFNLLPILMFVAQVVIARTTSAKNPTGKGAGLAMWTMPVIMTLLFYPFPAGCMLFWTTGNILQVFEQRFVASQVAKHAAS